MHTLDDAVRRFLRQFDNPNTVATYALALGRFREAFQDRLLASITAEEVEDWDYALRHDGFATNTVYLWQVVVKAFWSWCVEREYVDKDPSRYMKLVRREVGTRKDDYMPDEAIVAFFRHFQASPDPFLRARNIALFALMVNSSKRGVDLTRIRLSGVDVETGQIDYHDKGDRRYTLAVASETVAFLRPWLDIRRDLDPDPPHEWLFVSRRIETGHHYPQLQAGSIRTLFKRTSQTLIEQGITDRVWGTHTVRRAFTRHMAASGVPIEVTQEAMGHAHSEMTKVYYPAVNPYVTEALEEHALTRHLGLSPDGKEDNELPSGKVLDFVRYVRQAHRARRT